MFWYSVQWKSLSLTAVTIQEIISDLLHAYEKARPHLGVLGIRDTKVKSYGDTGYLEGKLKGYRIFRKEIPGYRASNLCFLKYKIGSSINVKDVESEKNG